MRNGKIVLQTYGVCMTMGKALVRYGEGFWSRQGKKKTPVHAANAPSKEKV